MVLIFEILREDKLVPFVMADVFECQAEYPNHPCFGVPWLRESRTTHHYEIFCLDEFLVNKPVLMIKDYVASNQDTTVWFVDTPIPTFNLLVVARGIKGL